MTQLSKENILSAIHHLACHLQLTAHCSLPERHIEHMMQPKRNQRTFNNTINPGSHIARTVYQRTQAIDSILNHRPYKIHGNSHKDINHTGNNRNKPGSSKERKHLGKLNLVILIVQSSNSQPYNHASKHPHLQRRDSQDLCHRTV